MDKEEIDYKLLLEKYIKHVISCEGTDFISDVYIADEFTLKEREELKQISNGIIF